MRQGVIALFFSSVVFSGCATDRIVPQEVRIPVPVSCLKEGDSPVRPSMMSDEQLDGLDDKRAVVALGQDRRIRQAYEARLEAALAACK